VSGLKQSLLKMYRTAGEMDEMDNFMSVLNSKRAKIEERKEKEKLILLEYQLKSLRKKKEQLQSELKKTPLPGNPLVCFQMVHGLQVECRPNESIALIFSPHAKVGDAPARLVGPYEVVLKRVAPESHDIRLHSYVLPLPGDQDLKPGERHFADRPNNVKQPQPAAYLEHKRRQKSKDSAGPVIPIAQLADDYLNGEEEEMKVFAQTVSAMLNAYTYRMCQVVEMIRRFPEEVDQVKCSRTLELISFVLRLHTEEDDEENVLLFRISLGFDPDKVRPRDGSMRVKFLGDYIEDHIKDQLVDQCEGFYQRDLADAVTEGFKS